MDLQGMYVRERKGKRGRSFQIIIERPPCPETGKRRRIFKTVSNVTKKQAERIGMQMMTDIESDSFLKINSLTVEKYFREWHDTYIVTQKPPTTSATYLYNLENYIFPSFGNLRLQSLTTIEIQRWINDLSVKSPLSDNPLSPKSIRNLYMNLNAGLKRAVMLGYLVKNPAANVEFPIACGQTKNPMQSHGCGAAGGNQDMGRTKGGLTPKYILPWMRMVVSSEYLLQQVPQMIVISVSNCSKG